MRAEERGKRRKAQDLMPLCFVSLAGGQCGSGDAGGEWGITSTMGHDHAPSKVLLREGWRDKADLAQHLAAPGVILWFKGCSGTAALCLVKVACSGADGQQ